ncbi:MAG: glyoxylate carboligase [Actinobacteria bacterium]|nr:glyoxylate carboligase [Actinomycetota bacterium]
MPRMHCMEAAVRILEDEGVDLIFGIPGANINSFYRALQTSTKIRHVTVRHEEAGSHMAEGWARATGNVGVCVGTSGPAGTNFITGLYSALSDSIPIIAITGQHLRAFQGKEGFQAVDIHEIARPVCKRTYYVRDASNVPYVFREAFRIAREGRPGPVLIDLPIDVQQGEVDYDPAIDRRLPFLVPPPDRRQVRRAVEMILDAKKPILLVGGGALLAGASDAAVKLAEHLQLPVCNTGMGKGAVPYDHRLYAGEVGIQTMTRAGNHVFLQSDLVLAVGCRFADRHTGKIDVYLKDRKFIHVDIEPTQIGRIIPTELGIVSDARLALEAMLEVAREMMPAKAPTAFAQEALRAKLSMHRRWDHDAVPIKPQRVFKEMHEFFDDDTYYVTCIGLYQIWSGQFQRINKPGHYHYCGGAGPLGWDLPAAMGFKLAKPLATVVNITGDYSIQFCGEEMATAVEYDIPVLVVIINNGNLSLIRQNQKYAHNNLRLGVDLWYGGEKKLVDFVAWAQAYGAWGERVVAIEQIKPALRRALASGKPAIVDIMVDPDEDCAMGQSLEAIREFDAVVDLPVDTEAVFKQRAVVGAPSR